MENPQSKIHQNFVICVEQETSKIKKFILKIVFLILNIKIIPVLPGLSNVDKLILQGSFQNYILELLGQVVKQ